MKLRTLLIFAMLSVNIALSQVNKLKATAFAYRYINDYQVWSDWSDWENCDILCVLDISKDRITVYSKETQIYDIIDSEDGYYDKDGDYIWILEAIDDNGLKCKVKLITREASKRVELYVNYSDFQWVYNVYFMD